MAIEHESCPTVLIFDEVKGKNVNGANPLEKAKVFWGRQTGLPILVVLVQHSFFVSFATFLVGKIHEFSRLHG